MSAMIPRCHGSKASQPGFLGLQGDLAKRAGGIPTLFDEAGIEPPEDAVAVKLVEARQGLIRTYTHTYPHTHTTVAEHNDVRSTTTRSPKE